MYHARRWQGNGFEVSLNRRLLVDYYLRQNIPPTVSNILTYLTVIGGWPGRVTHAGKILFAARSARPAGNCRRIGNFFPSEGAAFDGG
jgi:hypothetical protein